MIFVATVILFCYLISVQLRMSRYGSKEYILSLLWLVIKIATIIGFPLMMIIVYYVSREKLPPEAPVIYIISFTLGVIACFVTALMQRQLLLQSIQLNKKYRPLKLTLSILFFFLGFTMLMWQMIAPLNEVSQPLAMYDLRVIITFL
ncbi:hypothetical protein CVU83_00005, partial [Candidatus Falkowbacteria bacterium HGW-Falkowbacteria-2]